MQSEQKNNGLCLVNVRRLSFSVCSEWKDFAKYRYLPRTLMTFSLHLHSMLHFSHPPVFAPCLKGSFSRFLCGSLPHSGMAIVD